MVLEILPSLRLLFVCIQTFRKKRKMGAKHRAYVCILYVCAATRGIFVDLISSERKTQERQHKYDVNIYSYSPSPNALHLVWCAEFQWFFFLSLQTTSESFIISIVIHVSSAHFFSTNSPKKILSETFLHIWNILWNSTQHDKHGNSSAIFKWMGEWSGGSYTTESA